MVEAAAYSSGGLTGWIILEVTYSGVELFQKSIRVSNCTKINTGI